MEYSEEIHHSQTKRLPENYPKIRDERKRQIKRYENTFAQNIGSKNY